LWQRGARAALDRDAAFIMGTSSKRRAQYPRERPGEKWGVWYQPDRESYRPQDETPQQSSQVANGGLVCRCSDGRLENVSGNSRRRTERDWCFLRAGLFRVKSGVALDRTRECVCARRVHAEERSAKRKTAAREVVLSDER